MPMFDVFLAELLVLSLLILLSVRVFFTKRARIDAAAILAPTAFVFSLLIFFIWGADFFVLCLILLSFFSFLLNLRSLMRLSARVVVDYYNARFVIPSMLLLLLSTGVLVLLVIFHPVHYRIQDFGVTRTKIPLTGTLSDGYRQWELFYDRPIINAMVYEYVPEKNEAVETEAQISVPEAEAPAILFVPKCTAMAIHYEPYALMLAQRGYRVLMLDVNTGDRNLFEYAALNTRFFRRFYTLFLREFQKDDFLKAISADVAYTMDGYKRLAQFALQRYGQNTDLFFVMESISSDTANILPATFRQNTLGIFWLNRIGEYKTEDFGFIAQTDPLLAYFFDIDRDASFFIPRYVAGKISDAIEQAKKLAVPVEVIKSAAEPDETPQ